MRTCSAVPLRGEEHLLRNAEPSRCTELTPSKKGPAPFQLGRLCAPGVLGGPQAPQALAPVQQSAGAEAVLRTERILPAAALPSLLLLFQPPPRPGRLRLAA